MTRSHHPAPGLAFQDFLDKLDASGQLAEHPEACMHVMLSATEELSLSSVAAEARGTAERYWRVGDTTDSELEAARVACWESIEGRDTELADPQVSATRAVLCLLYPLAQIPSLHEQLHWFAQFAEGAGTNAARLASLLATAVTGEKA